jgi:hypothetical protein
MIILGLRVDQIARIESMWYKRVRTSPHSAGPVLSLVLILSKRRRSRFLVDAQPKCGRIACTVNVPLAFSSTALFDKKQREV